MSVHDVKQRNDLRAENTRLKMLLAEQELEDVVIKAALRKK